MTTLIIKVDDEEVESFKKTLNKMPYVRDIVVAKQTVTLAEPSQSERIKSILEAAKGKKLFDDIEDPVEWQREIRNCFGAKGSAAYQ